MFTSLGECEVRIRVRSEVEVRSAKLECQLSVQYGSGSDRIQQWWPSNVLTAVHLRSQMSAAFLQAVATAPVLYRVVADRTSHSALFLNEHFAKEFDRSRIT